MLPSMCADSRLYLTKEQCEVHRRGRHEKECACSDDTCNSEGSKKGGYIGGHEDSSDNGDVGAASVRAQADVDIAPARAHASAVASTTTSRGNALSQGRSR